MPYLLLWNDPSHDEGSACLDVLDLRTVEAIDVSILDFWDDLETPSAKPKSYCSHPDITYRVAFCRDLVRLCFEMVA